MSIYTHPLDGYPEFPTDFLSDPEAAIRTLSSRYREQSNRTNTLTNSDDLAEWVKNSKPKVTLWRTGDVVFLFQELVGYKKYVEKLGKTWKGLEPDVDAVWRMDGLLDKAWKERLMYDLDKYDHTGYRLPSEFTVSEQGTSTKITSYINNLTLPGHDVLFHLILEKTFTQMLPLFDHALADLAGGGCLRDRSTRTVYYTISEDKYIGDYHSDNEGLLSNAWTPPKMVASRMLQGKTVKVVRMLEVRFSPSNPVYQDANPQIDGMANERRIATGMYLYEEFNVIDVSIGFKHRDFYPDREEMRRLHDSEGLLCRRDIGTTVMKENRAIVFPNVYESILRGTKQLGKLPEEVFQSILGYCVGTIMPLNKAVEYKKNTVWDREYMMRYGINYDDDDEYDKPIQYYNHYEYDDGDFDDWF
ncbi:hypothetical protein TWF706_002463 [Orbilia oligospora]|uniref:DUF4246 domain-containing protein n=1 Tax=Orbilia oligospora TaxID=2813651 RepID=A0A7C8JFT2_ORBOL|nr:hypothetical protein TWF706_002463 [Orbilia oligospora]KAF3092212.1 hypothetical protein TWF103_011340 [Orbilia oligospora]KAF3120857.1 hypothetical protein TWF703_002295 [Orbilia oligospora]